MRTAGGGRLWIVFLVAFIALGLLLIPYAYLPPSENGQSVTNAKGTFLLSPTDIFYSGNSAAYVSLNLIGNLTQKFTGNVTVNLLNATSSVPTPKNTLFLLPQVKSSYFSLFLHSTQLHSGSNSVAVAFNDTVVATFLVTVGTASWIPWLDIGALALPFLFALTVWLAPPRPRWMAALSVPLLIAVAALFGQRYDMFFMLSSGVRELVHVNPFVQSAAVPGYLKWIYPPFYVPYSALSAIIYHSVLGLPLPPNSQLNYPGAYLSNPYASWLAFVPAQLPIYWLILKVPMLMGTIGIYYLLSRKFKIPSAEKLWLLNPFVILVGVGWGQLDILAASCLALSLLFYQKGDTFSAAGFAAIGGAVKIFPALLIPFILLRSRQRTRDLLPILATVGVVFAIYWYTGSVMGDLGTLLSTNSQPNSYGAFYANGLTWQILIPWQSFPPLLILVFAPLYLYEIFRFYRGQAELAPIMVEVFLIFYLTYNLVNSQYFIYIVFLLLLAKDYRGALLFSFLPALYLLLTQSLTYFINPALSYWYYASPLGQAEQLQLIVVTTTHLSWILALAATAIYLIRLLRSDGIHALRRDVRRALRLQRPGAPGTDTS